MKKEAMHSEKEKIQKILSRLVHLEIGSITNVLDIFMRNIASADAFREVLGRHVSEDEVELLLKNCNETSIDILTKIYSMKVNKTPATAKKKKPDHQFQNKEYYENKQPTGKENIPEQIDTTNIYVSGFENHVTSAELQLVFSKFGQVHSCEIITNKKNKQRRYAFVNFVEKAGAARALGQSGNISVKMNRLQVYPSISKCTVYLGNIPQALSCQDLTEIVHKHTTKQCSVVLKEGLGYAFLTYADFPTCFSAQKLLKESDFVKDNHIMVQISRDQPKNEATNTLYVTNLAKTTTKEKLELIFEKFGEVQKVTLVNNHNQRIFGFVRYLDIKHAAEAKDAMTSKMIGGSLIRVEFAKHKKSKKH